MGQNDGNIGTLSRIHETHRKTKISSSKVHLFCCTLYILFSKWWSFFFCYKLGYKPPMDGIHYYMKKIRELQDQIVEMREDILRQQHSHSWIIIFKYGLSLLIPIAVSFRTQRAATVAGQVLLHSESGNTCRVDPAPGPDEINWQALWKSKKEKHIRGIIALPFLIFLIGLPLGLLAGGTTR